MLLEARIVGRNFLLILFLFVQPLFESTRHINRRSGALQQIGIARFPANKTGPAFDMIAHRLCLIVPLCTVIAFTSACSKPQPEDTSATRTYAVDKLVVASENAGAVANDAQSAGDALKPNERVQRTIQLDVGNGPASFRSIATKVDDDIGKKTAERLASAES